MQAPGAEAIGLVIDILLCCILLFVLRKVGQGIEPLGAGGSIPRSLRRAMNGRRSGAADEDADKETSLPDDRYDQVLTLAARGVDRQAIARRLSMTDGEVALVLDLKQSRNERS